MNSRRKTLKEVGIITFHSTDNFGVVMQAYALMKTVKNFGFDVEIIDFKPKRLISQYKLFGNLRKRSIKSGLYKTILFCIKRILMGKRILKRIRNYESFRKEHFNLSGKSYFSKEELMKDRPFYDYYITGSDQVWNPDFFINIRAFYFLDYAVEESKKVFKRSIGVNIEMKNVFG